MEIHDTRTVADFQTFTFSGHARSQVLKSLSESIHLGHADYACFWALELLCSGLVHSLWTTFFECTVIHIHRLCPNAILYIANAYERFAAIEQHYPIQAMTQIRNREDARDLVCRTAAVLALCRKEKPPKLPTIKPEHDFTQQTIRENTRATTQNASIDVVLEGDPYELRVPINELCYELHPNVRDATKALYWIAWIFKYCSVAKKTTKQTVNFAPRPNEAVDAKFSSHPIWLCWSAVFDAARSNPHVKPFLEALFNMHNLRWQPGLFKSRVPFLLCAVILLCEGQSLDTFHPANSRPSDVETVLQSIPRWIETIVQTRDGFYSR